VGTVRSSFAAAACLLAGCVSSPPIGTWAYVAPKGYTAIALNENGRCGAVEAAFVPDTGGHTGVGSWCTYSFDGRTVTISHIAGEALPSPMILKREVDGLSVIGISGERVTLRPCPQSSDAAMAPNSRLLSDACASALRASFSAPKPGR
jgi:hypothetical protein